MSVFLFCYILYQKEEPCQLLIFTLCLITCRLVQKKENLVLSFPFPTHNTSVGDYQLDLGLKNKKYKTNFSDNFKEQFPFVTNCLSHVSDHQHKFHFTICNVNISRAQGKSNNITRHAETPGHKKRALKM